MPRGYTVSISIVESPVIPISIHSALGTARALHCPWILKALCIRRPSIDDHRRRCRPRRCRRCVITVLVVVLACNNKDEWLRTRCNGCEIYW